jgi:hypothetical protein
MDSEAQLSDLLEIAYEAVRSFNHRTLGQTIIAPEAYRILGSAAALAAALPQAMNQVGDGLRAALREFDVYDENRSPAESVDAAQAQLAAAAEAFERAYQHLSDAQTAINLQGVNTDSDDRMVRRPRLQSVDSADVENA